MDVIIYYFFIINIIIVNVAWMSEVTITSAPGLGCNQSNLQLVERALSSILHNPKSKMCSSLCRINLSSVCVCVEIYLHCLHLTNFCKSI
jgi:hypothetical protein